ncbi:uncharacterized protein LOC113774036 [Coffea eugenioides]|uniref:uncharacterized protein LOC113774036 n=1 Tax=Coffea eugenioides TaxID=49369 RepID=UPI000F6095C6|nr:uncharacterized protein LOC113774036 [Coffea eugenioides]
MSTRLQYYVITPDDVLSDENIINFALFADCDPIMYEEAACDDHDLIFIENNPEIIAEFRRVMIKQFQMTDMRLMSYFLEVEVFQSDSEIFISEKKCAGDILKKFKMDTTKSIMTLVEEKLSLIKKGAVNLTYFKSLVGHLSIVPTKIYCDSKSTIELSKNPVFHGHSKHINIKYHFIRELVRKREIEVDYYRTEEQVVDIFIKALKKETFVKLKKMLGMSKLEELGLREAM